MFLNSILCLVQNFLDALFGILNSALGGFLPSDLVAPMVGCEVEEEPEA